MSTGPVLQLSHVTLRRDDRHILRDVTWRVAPGDRWVVLGPNGSGKTTLCRIASLHLHPTRGEVELLGQRLGRVDVRILRARVGFTSAAVAAGLRDQVTALEVVMMGKHAALAPYWHEYTDEDRRRATHLLERFGVAHLADARFGTLSSGERQRALLGRALMRDPALLLLDEPTAGLDVGGREDLLQRLGGLAGDPTAPPLVMITHHVEEIPPGVTHVLVLRDGAVLAQGPIEDTLTAALLSAAFDLPLELECRRGRWRAWTDA